MKRLFFFIILSNYSFAMEPSLTKQPKSLKVQSCVAILKGLMDRFYDYDKIAPLLPQDLFKIIKPHTLTREITDVNGSKFHLSSIYEKTLDCHYGLIRNDNQFGKDFEKDEKLYRIDLHT
ncbi:MAG TPA: hypothetical protein VJ201_07240, partial [Candidatus Babeliales bacterium]|nr:hypothetical protein [Candidatus Babeliales bacterium]